MIIIIIIIITDRLVDQGCVLCTVAPGRKMTMYKVNKLGSWTTTILSRREACTLPG